MKALFKSTAEALLSSFKDLLPIIVVISVFQVVVLQQPVPELGRMLTGVLLVLLGLTLFIRGLQMALFPLGEEMAYNFVRRGNLWWLLLFSFTLREPGRTMTGDEADAIRQRIVAACAEKHAAALLA